MKALFVTGSDLRHSYVVKKLLDTLKFYLDCGNKRYSKKT